MSARPYEPAVDHGAVRGSLHIENIVISEDRGAARIVVGQRNQPSIKFVCYFGLTHAGQPFMVSSGHLDVIDAAFGGGDK